MIQRRPTYVPNVEFRELSNELFRSTIRPLEPLQLESAESCPVQLVAPEKVLAFFVKQPLVRYHKQQ